MNQDMAWQLIRYALLIGGGVLVGMGWITTEQLTTIIAAVGTLFVAGWGVYVKWNSTSVPDHTAARPDVPTVSPVTGAEIPGPGK